MLSSFRTPPPDEAAARDRLHRVFPGTGPATVPEAAPEPVAPSPGWIAGGAVPVVAPPGRVAGVPEALVAPPGRAGRRAEPVVAPAWPSGLLGAPFLDVLPDDPGPSEAVAAGAAHVLTGRPAAHRGPTGPSPGPEPFTGAATGSVFSRSAGSAPVESAPDPAPPSALPGRGAFDPGRRGLRALAAVAALVVALAAYLAWQARPSSDPVPEPAVVVPDAPRPSAPASPQVLVVAVTGRVRKPGLVRLPPGSRVADAIEAAGGALPDTDLSTVNLARKVTDGELIAVAVPGLPAAGAPGGDGGPANGGLVNLNTATLAQLDALPGVGPVLAQRILDHRARHGEFRAVGDLRQVEGIGESKFAQLKELVTV